MNESNSLVSDGTYRAHWLRTVMRSPQINDSSRVLLVALALHMDANGRVSVPREDLGRLLDRSDRKMADKFKVALASGFLVQTARGQKHQTAVYMAAINGEILSLTVGGHPEVSSLSMTVGGQAEDSQGDGYKHPESGGRTAPGNSQGDGYKHPENWDPNLSMTPEGQAEESMSDSQHDPRGSSQGYKGSGVEEEFDLEDSDALFDVRSEAKPEPEPAESTKRKTPVPKDFAITPEMRAWAADKTPLVDIVFETEQFVDHWMGKRELRADWVATWRTWMRNQQKWTTAANARQKPSGQQGNGSGSVVPPRGTRRRPFGSKRETA